SKAFLIECFFVVFSLATASQGQQTLSLLTTTTCSDTSSPAILTCRWANPGTGCTWSFEVQIAQSAQPSCVGDGFSIEYPVAGGKFVETCSGAITVDDPCMNVIDSSYYQTRFEPDGSGGGGGGGCLGGGDFAPGDTPRSPDCSPIIID